MPISAHHDNLPVQIQHLFAVSAAVMEFHGGFYSDAHGRLDCMKLSRSCCFFSNAVVCFHTNALLFWLYFLDTLLFNTFDFVILNNIVRPNMQFRLVGFLFN